MAKPRLLIIDDSDIDNSYIELLIDVESIEVDFVIQSNGIHGLAYLEEKMVNNFPHFILVDINMPLMNGFEFIKEYEERFYQKFPDSKIYVMSSTRRLSEIEEAKKSKVVDDFIEKPITKIHFDRILRVTEEKNK